MSSGICWFLFFIFISISTRLWIFADSVEDISSNRFMWDPSKKSWNHFLYDYCRRSCSDWGIEQPIDSICPSLGCYPCTCDSMCHRYGTCCVDFDPFKNYSISTEIVLPEPSSSPFIGMFSCKLPPSPMKGDVRQYMMITKCPSTWSDVDIRRKCEHPLGFSMDDITPYSVNDSGLTFSNLHCVKCHGYDTSMAPEYGDERHVSAWRLRIICKHYQYFYHLNHTYAFYKLASDMSRTFCQVIFLKPQEGLYLRACQPMSSFVSPVVDRCTLDIPHVTRLCHELEPRLSYQIPGYKNVFCAICNGVAIGEQACPYPLPGRFIDEEKPLDAKIPPMYLLLSAEHETSNEHLDKVIECSKRGRWLTHEGECISPDCPAGKQLGDDGQCESAIPQIQGLGYNLTVIFSTHHRVSEKDVDTLNTWILDTLREFVSEFDLRLKFRVTHSRVENSTTYGMLESIGISGHILASTNMKRDIFEHTMANFTSKGFGENEAENPLNATLRRNHLGSFITNIANATNLELYQLETFVACGDVEYPSTLMNTLLDQDNQTTIDYIYHERTKCMNKDLWQVTNLFIDYTVCLTCPFVSFNVTREPIIENDSVVFTFILRDIEINVTSADDVSFQDGQLLVCIDYINDLTKKVASRFADWKFSNDPVAIAEYYIEIVCLGTSIAFLIVSVVTYCLFPALRSLPGLNNMSLCVSLLAAQISLMLTSLAGLRGYFPKPYCLVHAVFFHYSWLATFMWMNICCIHMYRVFTSTGSQLPDARSDKKRHRRYCLFAFGIPILIVGVTSAITLAATDGESPGYSDQICFLDTSVSVLIIVFGILIPFAFVTLSNSFLFVLTVCEIVKVSRLAEQAGTRRSHGVIAYVKLSTLTGIFFVLAAVAVQFKSPTAALVASPFAALLGLFIFLSFLANAHVKELYRDFFFGKVKNAPRSFSYSRSTSRRTNDSKVTSQSNTTFTSM